MSAMTIYNIKPISESIIFKPTRLCIKKLNDTYYFCKSTKKNIESYTGSGVKWKSLVKKYGRKNIKTLWVSDWYTDPHEIQKVALHFSKENNIVDSEMWANLKPEDGLSGGSTSEIQSNPETKRKRLETWKKNGTNWFGENNPMFGKSQLFGKDNPAFNATIFSFYNTNTKEIVKMTQYDFCKEFNLSRSAVCNLVSEHNDTVKGWKLLKNKDKENKTTADKNIYSLYNTDTGELFIGTRKEFKMLTNSSLPKSSPNKKILSSKKWKFMNDDREDNRKGSNHSRFDHNLYTFRNVKTGETVKMTQYDFKMTYLPSNNNIPGLISGKHKVIKGWELITCHFSSNFST